MKELLKNYTLLYAEDEEDVQKSFSQYFATYFKEVIPALDGKSALELYEKHQPDVLVLDINLPFIDGLEVAKKVREKDKTTRIVILTAHTEKEILLRATEIDMSKYLTKPVSRLESKKMLEKVANELFELSNTKVHLGEEFYYLKDEMKLINQQQEISLSDKEERLLKLFIDKLNQPVSIEDIINHVWDNSLQLEISKESVKSQVSYLRKKLPENSIENVYGVGYKLKI